MNQQSDEYDAHAASSVPKVGETLSWSNVNMKVSLGKNKDEKEILSSVWGECNPGETTAILGSSGAGKTSLFNVIAGRVSPTANLSIDAEIYIGGRIISPKKLFKIRKQIAFVAQEDSLNETSTPRESMRFSAKLRLPRSTTDNEIDTLVNGFIKQLGLTSCADTIVGGGFKKGISGGEKKRTSVGVELIVRPSIVLLDEPTSGLDAYSAEQVCEVLKKVAVEQNTCVLFTIHQPAADLFMSFDRVMLMNRGKIMYVGKTSDVRKDFDDNGHPIKEGFNAAEWMLKIAQVKSDEELISCNFYPEDKRSTEEKQVLSKVTDTEQQTGASFLTQLKLLQQRELRTLARDSISTIIGITITGFLAVIFGLFFWNIGRLSREDQTEVQAQLGAISNVLISTMFGQAQGALMAFPSQRPLFLREYSTNHYSVLPYFISKLGTEAFQASLAILVQSLITYFMIGFRLNFFIFFAIQWSLAMTSQAVAVFLGSNFSDPDSANQFFTILVVPQLYFSGVFLPIDLIPKLLRWSQYLCSIRYSSALAMIYEFADCEPGIEEENCAILLERNNVDPDDAWFFWLGMWGVFLVFRLAALFILQKKSKTFS